MVFSRAKNRFHGQNFDFFHGKFLFFAIFRFLRVNFQEKNFTGNFCFFTGIFSSFFHGQNFGFFHGEGFGFHGGEKTLTVFPNLKDKTP